MFNDAFEKDYPYDAALLEKYVLGLCGSAEKEKVEDWLDRDPDAAAMVVRMKKAVSCYCTSCRSQKVKSITTRTSSSPGGTSAKTAHKIVEMNCPGKKGLTSLWSLITKNLQALLDR